MKPKRKWLRRCRVCFRWCRIAAWALVFALICFAIYLSEAGLPAWARNRIAAAAAQQGVHLGFASMRLHWLQGITIEKSTVTADGFPGTFTAELAVLDLDQSALLRRELRLQSVSLRGADLTLTPAAPRLDPILVHGMAGRLSFPASNIVALEHLEGRWRNGFLSIQLAVTNPAAMAPRPSSVPAVPRAHRSLTNFVDHLAKVLTRLELGGEPSLRLAVAGDAADPLGLTAVLSLSVPNAVTPWGSVTNLNLQLRSRDLATATDDESATLELTADGAATPWGGSRAVKATVEFKPEDGDVREWRTAFRATATAPRSDYASARSIEFDGKARLRTDEAWPVQAEVNLRATGLTSAWARAESLALRVSRHKETNLWAALETDGSLGFWNRLLSHRLEFEADASRVEAAGAKALSLGIEAKWHGPMLTVPRLAVAFANGRASLTGALDVQTRELSGTAASDFDLASVRDLLTPSGQRWVDQFTWGAPPVIDASARLRLPAWNASVQSWRHDLQPGLEMDGQVDAARVAYHGVPFDRAHGRFSLTNLVWRVADTELERPEGAVHLALTSRDQGTRQSVELRSTISPEALAPLFGPNADKVFAIVQFPKPPLLEGRVELHRDEPKRNTFAGRVATTNVHVRGIDTGEVAADVSFAWPLVRFENVRIERGTQWLAAAEMGFNLEDHMLTITNGTSFADIEPVGRIIGPKTWGMLSAYEFLDTPRAEINGITPVHEEDRPKADLHFKVKGGRFRWKYFNIDRLDGEARWTGNGLQLTNLAAQAYSGNVAGWAGFDFQDDGRVDFRFGAGVADLQLKSLLQDLGVTNRADGRLTGSLVISDGSSYRPSGWNGYGFAALTNGFLWDYPLFAFLSPVVDAVAPGAGRDAARSARGDYTITSNVITSDNLEIRASTVRLLYRGSVGFDHRLAARVEATLLRDTWFVGPMLSFALTPFAKAFEYRVGGTLSHPEMEPVYLPGFLMKLLTPFNASQKTESDPAPPNPKVDEQTTRP